MQSVIGLLFLSFDLNHAYGKIVIGNADFSKSHKLTGANNLSEFSGPLL